MVSTQRTWEHRDVINRYCNQAPGATSTKLVYLHEDTLREYVAKVVSVEPVASLPEADRVLLKNAADDDHVVTAEETIFYVQGGGQPTDTGSMTAEDSSDSFAVVAVRKASDGRVLHFGRFSAKAFTPGQAVKQSVDAEKRDLHSRIHDAGHIVGLAVRQVEAETPELKLEESKAQHYPGAAHVEFIGLIDGKYKEAIQKKVDEMLEKDLPVKTYWWSEQEAREKCVYVAPEMTAPDGELLRAVDIVGAGAYPCGGTHVASTKLCGAITVRKISRSKGTSKVSYETK